ncbi:hypothetical protein [Nonomuraea roseoviolacea]|uniref:Uncharacterized protein n=1 Tax=Nonomuraea roseoviolacea subsp. carminata TaxID=160689 RepID=A0ABT1K7B2_9ACTN|nr:hypothetical protein [Nonomuraea roseoviolacea]MCP2349326.1 hypothetical protein [Nonomuraea roseoviolacea subsp. carminata]
MRTAAAILSFVLAVTILPAGSAASAASESAASAASTSAAVAATSLPGGKATFVVSQGHLKAASQQNWVRLGTYRFAANGTVSAAMYLWWQRHPTARQRTGTVPDPSCTTRAGGRQSRPRACEVLTAGGFTGAPGESRTGAYTVAGNVLTIRWNIAQQWTEQWYVRTSSDGKLARLDLKQSTLATNGYGYGSNAAIDTRRAMSSVRAFPGSLRQDLTSWASGRLVTSGDQPFGHSSFRACAATTSCLTYLQPSSRGACQKSGGCPRYGGGTRANISSIQYYLTMISKTDRRDTLWHWCTCLAMERHEFCYTGNSHVKPLMQIIDDTGAFRGWVGVEASFSTGSRATDMLAVLRISDFR